MKTCTKCGKEKAESAFCRDKHRSDGLNVWCRDCAAASNRARKEASRDLVLALNRKNQAAWRARNPDRSKAVDVIYRESNRSLINSRRKSAYADSPEKHRERSIQWKKEHPEITRLHCHNRRAREKCCDGRLSKGLAERLFTIQRGKCACCGSSIAEGYHLDHRMPLALYGPNTDDNIQLLCATCNLSKGAKHPIDFMQSRGFLL